MVYVVVRDSVVFEKQYDTLAEAENYVSYCQRNYLGRFQTVPMKTVDFRKWLKGLVSIFDCIEKARAYGSLARR